MASYSYSGGYQTTTTYGGGGEGGGYMDHGGSSQEMSGGSRNNNDSLRPVTIKQLIESVQPYPDADFKVDGVALNEITFVGQIRNISAQPTNVTYKLDDGTGIIEVKKWVDVDKEASTAAAAVELSESRYVRVFGRVKGFHNKRFVGAHIMRPVTDFNEISMHLLEATYAHLYFTIGPPESIAAGGGAKADHDDAMFVGQSYGRAGENPAPTGGNRQLSQSKPMARRVLGLLQSAPQSNEGLHIRQIASDLGVTVDQVLEAGDELLHSGSIYTTIDDETWAVLEY